MSSNPDPRPGRLVLPAIVVLMGLFTYVFVGQLPDPDMEVTEIDTETPTDDSVPEETTDTTQPIAQLAPELDQYLGNLRQLDNVLKGHLKTMRETNDKWDAQPKQITYNQAIDELRTLEGDVSRWMSTVSAETPPLQYQDLHADLARLALDIANAARETFDGLQGAGSQPRIDAYNRFDAAATQFSAQVASIIEQAENPAP